jgi:hypothetical protein
MKILLLGSDPILVWVKAFVEGVLADVELAKRPQLTVIQTMPTRELLSSLSAEPIDALILAHHAPFASGMPKELSPDVVRAEAQWGVLAIELARRSMKTLVLERRETQNWPGLLASLVSHLVTHDLPDVRAWPTWLESGETQVGPPPTPLLSSYLEPLFTAPAKGVMPPSLVWPREAFLCGDAPGEVLPATVELAGRARIVAYGPYLPLPSGSWRATACLGFSPDIGKMPFILEVDSGGAIARGFFEVEQGGIYTLKLDFQVVDPMHPVEMRLISQESALEGQLSLIEVELDQSC